MGMGDGGWVFNYSAEPPAENTPKSWKKDGGMGLFRSGGRRPEKRPGGTLPPLTQALQIKTLLVRRLWYGI